MLSGRRTWMCLGWVLLFCPWISMAGIHTPLAREDRIRAQEAIERVYYEHRIWPKENPGPKPPFERMISRAQIEAKVEDYLKKSVALDKFWQRPIQPEQLQTEMDRMAKQTQDPETLRELFASLENDPYLIAECLARPVLANRLIRNWYAFDARFHTDTQSLAEQVLKVLSNDSFHFQPGAHYSRVTYCLEDRPLIAKSNILKFVNTSITLPERQFGQRIIETPAEGDLSRVIENPDSFVILHTLHKTNVEIELESLSFFKQPVEIWISNQRMDLRSFDQINMKISYSLPSIPEAGCVEGWHNGILDDVPDGRYRHSAIWTGTEMIVWGGEGGYFNSGGRYNPATDSWTPTSTGADVPSGRSLHTAVWTGTEMIVWGGVGSSYLNSGGRYNPLTNTWRPTSTEGKVPSGRCWHTAIWTGTEMIIWGGEDDGMDVFTGGRYNPSIDSWASTAAKGGVPSARHWHTAVWTGEEMIVWGGVPCTTAGGRYAPLNDSWIATSEGANVPPATALHTAVWTGTEMIVWGGISNSNAGGRYNPASDSWISTSKGANAPAGREWHTAVWTGKEMIIWGGLGDSPDHRNDGGRYDPETDSWTATSEGAETPSARYLHTAVWTGKVMIVWGGTNNSYLLNTGGRYDPASNSWLPTFIDASAPAMRRFHTAIWTGAEMIVWGGALSYLSLNTGGLYNPATDSWISTSIGTGVPTPRLNHTAVWTGTEMIVWGGYDRKDRLRTGGRYDPVTDLWIPTSTGANVPSERIYHTAVWTGAEMIVWGGFGSSDDLSTGGRYNPKEDIWIPTSSEGELPLPRSEHTAVWTGSEMIVWGGNDGSNFLNTGGLYDPAADRWEATPISAYTPSAREWHSAIWTGKEMIVWGGWNPYTCTGARYDPKKDTWIPTSIGGGVPSMRGKHTAVWTGKEMIVWGGFNYDGIGTHFNSGGRYDPSDDSWIPTPVGENEPSARADHTTVWTGKEMIIWGGMDGSYTNSGGILRLCPHHDRPVEKP